MTDTLPNRYRLATSGAAAHRTAHPDAFRELATKSRHVCETAVNATDIAVMLEIDGINDAIATGAYGARDVQDLAERLLAKVPTRSAAPVLAGRATTQTPPSARLIRRGVLYAAPGAFYVAIAADFRSTGAGLAVIGATATGWMASQVIGFIAYRLTERSGPANTHAVLRRALLLAVPVAAALAAVGERAVGPVAATTLAAQVVFAAAAAVMLFYDADRVLTYCVIPGAAVAVVCAVDWPAPVPRWLPSLIAATAALLTALATAGAAWTYRSAATAPLRYPSARDLAGALPYVLYGLLCAAALAYRPVLDMTGTVGGDTVPGSALAVLPVVLVMGYGELEIRQLRTSCTSSASISTTVRSYQHRARAELFRLEIRIGAALTIATVATAASLWAVTGRGGVSSAEVLRAAATVILGCALVIGLVGCSFARPAETVVAFLVAFGLAAAADAALAPFDTGNPLGYLVACLLLLAAVHVVAARVVKNPVTVIG